MKVRGLDQRSKERTEKFQNTGERQYERQGNGSKKQRKDRKVPKQ